MQNDVISRGAVLEALERCSKRITSEDGCYWPFTAEISLGVIENVSKYIQELPALDAVPVVRCKDCKHYKPQYQGAHRNCTTPYCMRACATKVSPDDFCSRGEEMGGE